MDSAKVTATAVLAFWLLIGSGAAQLELEHDCGQSPALYEGEEGIQVWALRRGSTSGPYAGPETDIPALVLELVHKGGVGYVHGPILSYMFANVELDNVPGSVRWRDDNSDLPAFFRLVSNDGQQIYNHFAFVRCEKSPY